MLFASLAVAVGCFCFSHGSPGNALHELSNGIAIVCILFAFRQLKVLGFGTSL
jgi:hypothetical protein